MTILDEIEQLLPKLNADDRAVLALKLKAVSQFDPVVSIKRGKVDHSADDEGWVLQSFERVCRAHSIEHATPFYVKRYRGYNAFKKKVPFLAKLVRDADPRSRVVQAALLDLGWSLLYRHLQLMGIIVTAQAMINHAHLVAPCISKAVPGYIENGLLKFVIRPE
jgi:hypothetical protein